MSNLWTSINKNHSKQLADIDTGSIDTVLLNTKLNISAKRRPVEPASFELSDDTGNLVNESLRILKFGDRD